MTEIFSDGFQTQDFSLWTGTWVDDYCNLQVVTSPEFGENYALKAKGVTTVPGVWKGAYSYKIFDLLHSDIYCRFSIYFLSLPSDDWGYFFGVHGSVGEIDYHFYLGVIDVAGTKKWILSYFDSWGRDATYESDVIKLNSLCMVEIYVKVASDGLKNGEIHIWVNDVEVFTLTGLDNEGQGNVGKIWAGWQNGWGTWNGGDGIVIDNIMVADTRIGGESSVQLKNVIHGGL
jgi:hypothetical protein